MIMFPIYPKVIFVWLWSCLNCKVTSADKNWRECIVFGPHLLAADACRVDENSTLKSVLEKHFVVRPDNTAVITQLRHFYREPINELKLYFQKEPSKVRMRILVLSNSSRVCREHIWKWPAVFAPSEFLHALELAKVMSKSYERSKVIIEALPIELTLNLEWDLYSEHTVQSHCNSCLFAARFFATPTLLYTT